MQSQKQEQGKQYNRNTRDLPSLRTGDTVHIQLVPNMRRWAQGRVIKRVNARSYKVKTHKQNTTYTERPKQITRKPQRLIETMNYTRTWHPQQRIQ